MSKEGCCDECDNILAKKDGESPEAYAERVRQSVCDLIQQRDSARAHYHRVRRVIGDGVRQVRDRIGMAERNAASDIDRWLAASAKVRAEAYGWAITLITARAEALDPRLLSVSGFATDAPPFETSPRTGAAEPASTSSEESKSTNKE